MPCTRSQQSAAATAHLGGKSIQALRFSFDVDEDGPSMVLRRASCRGVGERDGDGREQVIHALAHRERRIWITEPLGEVLGGD